MRPRTDAAGVAASAWVRIALIYLAARTATTGFFLLAGALAAPGSRVGSDGGLGAFVVAWDAQWYWLIAVAGYPAELPLTETGQVAENAWAFLPVFPHVAAVVGLPFGSWPVGAFVVSLAAGYLACVVLFALLRERMDAVAATWAVVFFAAAPLSPLLQVGYAESLFLLLLLLGIRCVVRRRYAWLFVLVPVMGFTRPGVLAFALFLGLVGILRFVRRRSDALPPREIAAIVAAGAVASIVGFAWPVIAALATGSPTAYFDTEGAWRRTWTGEEAGFVPFEGWMQGARFWVETVWGAPPGWGVVVAVVVVAAVAALLLFEPHVRRLGAELRLWAASYLIYLVAVFLPQSSIFRLLLPLSPLWGAAALPRSLWWRGGVLVACLIGQWWWIWNMYGQGVAFWQIP
ncbi:hypothetical protein M4I32_02970 [Microbacterium sp. LRZ72]|uniref:hypothetical protein n=1 Tax=Microbacterium sp. LRZ72 TaxID=2942481 RepID=UPI0029B813BB|nr:hypothetical protein [Microbacterium sp. LRZ72]MDX2375757.1 hypothetical protein [Microbacterium sp. LRZ72]